MMAFSILFSVCGTPILFYGDEFCKGNDKAFYDEQFARTHLPDKRYLNRGRVDWPVVEQLLQDQSSQAATVHRMVSRFAKLRANYSCLGRGDLQFIDTTPSPLHDELHDSDGILAYTREYSNSRIFVIHNLTDRIQYIHTNILPTTMIQADLLDQTVHIDGDALILSAYAFHWFAL